MTKKNAPVSESNQPSKHCTKQDAILAILRVRSLNRFEAEAYGDHCLHSTIATLRSLGHVFHDEWETVRNRFGGETRVKRYWLIRSAR